jgi:acid phosphatase type 7
MLYLDQKTIRRFAMSRPCRYSLAAVLFCLFSLVSVAGAWAQDYWAPWVTKLATDSAVINWRGDDSGSGSVEYATASYYNEHNKFQAKVDSTTTGAYQHVPLSGLDPDTSYIYRVRPKGNEDLFGNRTFRTMPVSGPFTFIVMSDTHAQEKRFKWVADAIAANETDALFILDGGDYSSFDDETDWTAYFQYADGVLAKFPIFNGIGNHEYHNPGHSDGPPTAADQYHWTFDIPAGGALNHSFDCSGIRFVMLNSPDPNHANGDDPHTSLALAKSQESWLADQLNNTALGTFTIHHHPIWDYGRTTINRDLRPWQDLYHKYRISANFAGHTHAYQRYSVKGIPYFVIGNSGGKFADINEDGRRAKWYEYGDTRKLGYLKVTVDPENNRATAEEIFTAYVKSDDVETATAYDPPIVADTVTFPLIPNLRTLTVTKSGIGTGTVVSSPAAIDCGSTCQADFKETARVTLTPTPHSDCVFRGWTGACKGTGECSVVMKKDTTVGAIFEKGCTYSVSPSSKTVPWRGGNVTVKVTATGPGECPAPDVTNHPDWITFTVPAFTGNKGTVKLSAAANTGAARSATLIIGENNFAVEQKVKP